MNAADMTVTVLLWVLVVLGSGLLAGSAVATFAARRRPRYRGRHRAA